MKLDKNSLQSKV